MSLLRPLWQPASHFEQTDPSSERAVKAVALAWLGVLGALTAAGVLAGLLGVGPEAPSWFLPLTLGATVAGALFGFVLDWLLFAVLLYAGARVFVISYDGTPGRTFAVATWAQLPLVLGAGVSLLGVFALLVATPGGTPESFAAAFQSRLRGLDAPFAVLGFAEATWVTYVGGSGLAALCDDAVASDRRNVYLVVAALAYGGWLISVL